MCGRHYDGGSRRIEADWDCRRRRPGRCRGFGIVAAHAAVLRFRDVDRRKASTRSRSAPRAPCSRSPRAGTASSRAASAAARACWSGWRRGRARTATRCARSCGSTRPAWARGCRRAPSSQAFRARRPDAQVAYTFFSPSAESFARTVQRGRRRLPAAGPARATCAAPWTRCGRTSSRSPRPTCGPCSPARQRRAACAWPCSAAPSPDPPAAWAAPRARCWPPRTAAWTSPPPSPRTTRSASARWACRRSGAT